MLPSLRAKLVLALGVPLLAVWSGLAWLEYELGRREALANMSARLTELVARQAAELDGDLAAARQVARTLALALEAQGETPPEAVQSLIQSVLRDNPKVYGSCVAFEPQAVSSRPDGFAPYYCRDGQGGLRFVDIAARQPDYRDLDWYRPARRGREGWWTEPYFDAGVGERLMCTCSAPFRRDGRLRGVVTVDLSSDDLLDDIERMEVGSGYAFLVSGRGTFISHPDRSLVMRQSVFRLAERFGLEELAAVGREMVAGRSGTRRIRDDATGEPRWIVYAPVPSSGWSLAAVLPDREVMAPIHARVARSLGILGAGLAVLVGVVSWGSYRVTRPIVRLTSAAERLAAGDLDARVAEPPGRDEIARLARTFNVMVADLKVNIAGRIREEAARREVEAQIAVARAIQASLLPPPIPAAENDPFALHAINAPAKTVAGDFYDFFQLDGRRLAIVVADVSGKGVPAAVYMAVARTKLRDFASPDKPPDQLVAELNRSLIRENEQGMFVTMFVGYYDTATGELEYVNAGHNPPYVVRADGSLETLDPTGPLVAVFPDGVFRTERRRLEPGELVVLFTDGVTEAHAGDGVLFGEARLERLLSEAASDPPDRFCETVVGAVQQFSRDDLKDDVTVLALGRRARASAPETPR